ncbi:hypothetical protein JCM1840_000061 [Sporobolomyces johnsonii]
MPSATMSSSNLSGAQPLKASCPATSRSLPQNAGAAARSSQKLRDGSAAAESLRVYGEAVKYIEAWTQMRGWRRGSAVLLPSGVSRLTCCNERLKRFNFTAALFYNNPDDPSPFFIRRLLSALDTLILDIRRPAFAYVQAPPPPIKALGRKDTHRQSYIEYYSHL